LLQGFVITLLCVAFTVLPSVQSAYQILSQMATIIYLVMYLIMYVAAIRLRYTQPNKLRPFKIPGGNFGMWFVGIVGLLGALIAMAISFIPPTQISTGSPAIYIGILLIGSAVFVAIPFAFYAVRKPGWKAPDSDFEPFEPKGEVNPPIPAIQAIPVAAVGA
jgi:amino acid transporter